VFAHALGELHELLFVVLGTVRLLADSPHATSARLAAIVQMAASGTSEGRRDMGAPLLDGLRSSDRRVPPSSARQAERSLRESEELAEAALPACELGGRRGGRALRRGLSSASVIDTVGSWSVSRAPPLGSLAAWTLPPWHFGDLAYDRQAQTRPRHRARPRARGRSGRRRAAGQRRRSRDRDQ